MKTTTRKKKELKRKHQYRICSEAIVAPPATTSEVPIDESLLVATAAEVQTKALVATTTTEVLIEESSLVATATAEVQMRCK